MSTLVDAAGKPIATMTKDGRCPRCNAGKDRRRPNAGFGELHDVCGNCGYDFEEYTLGGLTDGR